MQDRVVLRPVKQGRRDYVAIVLFRKLVANGQNMGCQVEYFLDGDGPAGSG